LICSQINSHAFFAREKLYLTEFFPLFEHFFKNAQKFTFFRALERLWDAVPHPARGAASGLRQGVSDSLHPRNIALLIKM
jgi:hypothetical protein